VPPGRYVGVAVADEDDESFEEKMMRLAVKLREQQQEAAKLDAAIALVRFGTSPDKGASASVTAEGGGP
jgi:type I restriction-modification system DNA methylase subunit